MSMDARRVGVYVQALPVSLSDPASKERNFAEQFQDANFELSHSSKVALDVARKLGVHDVCAFGHHSVLFEALARGATSIVSLPLHYNPSEQARSIPRDGFSTLVIPENCDGPFSGAALAGAVAMLHNLPLVLIDIPDSVSRTLPKDSILLVKDLVRSDSIDIRRINPALDVHIEPLPVIGRAEVTFKADEKKHEELKGDARELSASIAKRLRRLVAPAYS